MSTEKPNLNSITFLLALALVLGLAIPASATHRASMVPLGTRVSVQASSNVLWVLPGKRELDPDVFGTPDKPKMLGALPVEGRSVSKDGESFTTTAGPTPFSDKVEPVKGEITLQVDDRTPVDDPNSLDKADLTAVFTGPEGMNEYKVELEKLIPVGPDHQFFGGAGTDIYMHGATGIGNPLMPPVWSYVTLWGYGDVYRNGERVGEKRLIHSMVTPKVRNDDKELMFSQRDDLRELNVHLILPPTKIVNGKPVESPVPTGYKLPNGNEQPFFHVNFYGVNIHGNRFLLDGFGRR